MAAEEQEGKTESVLDAYERGYGVARQIFSSVTHERPVEKVSAALAKAQAEFTNVPKGKTAKVQGKSRATGKTYEYSYQYADLADVMEMVRGPLAKHGLAVTHSTQQLARDWLLVTRLCHESGQYLETTLPIHAGSPQEMGSELTYMRRYGLGCVTGAVTDVDEDGQLGQDRPKTKAASSEPPQAGQTTMRPPPARKQAAKKGSRKKAAARKNDPHSKAGDGSEAIAKSSSMIWPLVWQIGDLWDWDKERTTEWFRDLLKRDELPMSTKDLDQKQVNALMKRLHDIIEQNTPPETNPGEQPDDDADPGPEDGDE